MASLEALPAPAIASPRHAASLPLRVAVTYSVPLVGVAVMWHMVGFYYLKYATDVLLLEPAIVGAIFGAARVWDAVSDPLAGYASDRTRSAIGRRRPWILASAVPLSLCFVALWWPVELVGIAQVVWVGAATFLFYTALTVFRIPHLSLAVELTRDVAARTRLFAASGSADVVGGLIGVGVLVVVAGGFAEIAELVVWVVLAVAVVTAPLLLWCGTGLREPRSQPVVDGNGPYAAFVDVWRNRSARVMVSVAFLPTLGLVIASTTAPYLADYVLGDPSMLAGVLLAFTLGTLSAMPLCPLVSRSVGLRATWLWARSLQGVAMAGYFAAPALGLSGLVALSVCVGVLEGFGGVATRALQAKVIEDEAERTGERREGTYFAFWNLATKTALGIAVFTVGTALQLAGFHSGGEQAASSVLAIRLLMSAIPSVCILAAVVMFARARV